MTKKDIRIFADQVAECGRILKEAKWDAIEIIAGVGSTLSRFMSKATNNRTDEYGGSVENRCRFAVEVIRAVKKRCGEDFTVLIRWSPVDFVEGGNVIEDAMKIVPILEKAGVAWHNCQVGWHESSIPLITKDIPDGYWSWISAELKKVAKVPVVTGYRETDPVIMEKILKDKKADIIGGLRFNIADPVFPNKAKDGRLDEINKCICCCRCLDDVISSGKALEFCGVNPRLGPELDAPLKPAVLKKKVVVIGSGPAGLSAALTAHKRGHEVVLFERGPRIGGCLVMSAIFSPMYERLTGYYKHQLKINPGIKVKLNTIADTQKIMTEKPDAVIVAAGGHPVDLDVPGINRGNVVRSHDFLELLNGKPPVKPGLFNKFMWNSGSVFLRLFYSPRLIKRLMFMPWPFGKTVAVIGGGLPGCELGREMMENKRKIVIIEEGKKVGFDVGASEKFHVLSLFKKSPDVQLKPMSKVVSITKKGVRTVEPDSTEHFYNVDTVAVTLGFEKNPDLADRLKGMVPLLFVIGDCAEPKRMADATKQGYLAALKI